MKRLYITTKDVWKGPIHTTNGQTAYHIQPDPKRPHIKPVVFKNIDLFNPSTGSHYIDLDDAHILIATDVEHSEFCLETWHGHPEVARLPHPVHEGNVTIHQTLNDSAHSAKQLKQHHVDALLGHKELKADIKDTVLTLSKKSKALHPLVCVTNLL